MLAPTFKWYNFCQIHSDTAREPAMGVEIADHVRTLREIIEAS